MGWVGSGWIRLYLCDELGWVEFFLTHHGRLGQKIFSTQPMHTPSSGGVRRWWPTSREKKKKNYNLVY